MLLGGKSAESRSHGARRSVTRFCVRSTARAAAAAKDTRTINDGLAVLEKAAKDGVTAE